MTIEKRDIITIKKQIPFMEQSMAMFGYRTISRKKQDGNWVLTLERATLAYDEKQIAHQKDTEEKLQLIEIITRKKRKYRELLVNGLLLVLLYGIQKLLFTIFNIDNTIVAIGLGVGLLMIGVLLVVSSICKGKEIIQWNNKITKLKRELLENNKTDVEQKQSDETDQTISVLFTRNYGFISEVIYWISGRQYTHAALGLGEQTEEFFSFDFRGFRREHPSHRKLQDHQKESLCYQFKVSTEEYQRVEQVIQECLSMQSDLRYNLLGMIFCVCRIYMPIKTGKVYFCSEFVSEQLKELQSFKLKKQANMYLPTNLSKALIFQDNLCRVLVNEI